MTLFVTILSYFKHLTIYTCNSVKTVTIVSYKVLLARKKLAIVRKKL